MCDVSVVFLACACAVLCQYVCSLGYCVCVMCCTWGVCSVCGVHCVCTECVNVVCELWIVFCILCVVWGVSGICMWCVWCGAGACV